MSTTFNGGRFVLPPGTTELQLPAKASTAVSVGDLLVWDATNKWVEPISLGTAGLSDTVANIGANFVGIALSGKLASDASLGYPAFPTPIQTITVASDAIYEANVASGTFNVGATVGGVTGATGDYTVASNVTTAQIIGYVVSLYTTAVTRIRVRLVGKFSPFVFADRN